MPVPARRRSWPSALAICLATLGAVGILSLGAGPGRALAAAREAPISASPAQGWTWPLPPPHVVVEAFRPPAEPWLAGQRGVLLQGHQREPVLAAGPGTVTFAGEIAGVGVVSVAHDGDLHTTYEPVDATVRRGQAVRAGEPLGRLTAEGSECAPAACLHWGLLRAGSYLDPLSLLGLEVLSLLPMADQQP